MSELAGAWLHACGWAALVGMHAIIKRDWFGLVLALIGVACYLNLTRLERRRVSRMEQSVR